ncbi:MAG: polysaccharide biosynthesis/export family protein [Bacteroidetes bacterium]|nr:polysaccharide biosynthesis/export family protein [Bacteroidota bacterium]
MTFILINKLRLPLLLFILFLISSCAAQRDYASQNYGSDIPEALLKTSDYIIKAGDKVKVQSFNNLASVLYESTVSGVQSSVTVPEYEAYVDNEGYIALPRAGKIKVAGHTQKSASEAVNQAYVGVINTPLFNVRVMNMRVKVLGAVNKQGMYYLEKENETLSEVLAMAEGVKYENMGKRLTLIRKGPDSSRALAFDLNAANLGNPRLNNIVMQDDDIVYVQPSRASVNSAKAQQYANFMAPLSLLINAAVLLITVTR